MSAIDIRDDLRAYLDHTRRVDITRRPAIWARHYDLWNEPAGELGFADNGHPRVTMYAALAPLALVPELRSVTLIVDGTTLEWRGLAVTSITMTRHVPEVVYWACPYTMDDEGKMTVSIGEPEDLEDETIIDVVAQLGESRRQAIWVNGWKFDDTIPVIEDMLGKITRGS